MYDHKAEGFVDAKDFGFDGYGCLAHADGRCRGGFGAFFIPFDDSFVDDVRDVEVCRFADAAEVCQGRERVFDAEFFEHVDDGIIGGFDFDKRQSKFDVFGFEFLLDIADRFGLEFVS